VGVQEEKCRGAGRNCLERNGRRGSKSSFRELENSPKQASVVLFLRLSWNHAIKRYSSNTTLFMINSFNNDVIMHDYMIVLKREILHQTLIQINYIQISALFNNIHLDVDKNSLSF